MTTPPDNKVTYLRPEHAKSALQRERARIVEAAIDEMGYSGPLLFAMDRVANRCGLSSETIKQHFNERQTLIETVGRTVSQILVDACVEQMTTQKSGIDRLLGVIRCHFDESISPRRLVAVWVLFYGATSQGSNYDEVFSEADDRIFSMIRRCVGDIIQNPPDSPQVLDISNAIYGIMDRYWLEEPLLRGSRSLVEYYESSFESIKNVLARLLPAAFDSDANTASTAHNGLLDSLIDYDPDPQKFDPVVKNLVNFIDTNDAEEIDLRRFCDAFEIEEKNILEDGRTWNDLLVESVRYIATIVDHEDQQALLSAGPDPKAQLDAIISYEDKSYFTRNRALWWQHVPTYKGLAQSILALDDANDKFLLQLLAEPLQALSDRLDRAADIHAIAKAILAIKNESWLSVYPGMTEKDFESLKRRDVDNCQALLVTTLRHAYSDLPVVTKMSAVPDNHRERIYNAAALAVLEHGLWGFTHSDLSRHCGLDAYRIRALFASKRQIISESIGWFCDLHHETCEQVLADDNLNGPEKLAYVAACFFRDQTYKSEVMALWNWAWMESQSDGDLRKICDGVDDAVLEYLCRAIDAVDDSLDDDTRDTVASLLAGLAERFNMPFSTEDRNNEHRERFLRELLALLKLVFPGIYQDWEPGMLLGQHDNASADNSTSDNVLTLDMTVEQSKQRVEKIIGASIRLISESGVTAATFPNVANETRIPIASIQFHFSTSHALLVAVLQHLLTSYRAWMDASPLITAATPESRLAGFVEARCELTLKHPDQQHALAAIYCESLTDPVIGRMYRAAEETSTDYIASQLDLLAQNKGVKFDSNFAAMGLQLGMEKMFDHSTSMNDRIDFDIHIERTRAWGHAYLRNFFPDSF